MEGVKVSGYLDLLGGKLKENRKEKKEEKVCSRNVFDHRTGSKGAR